MVLYSDTCFEPDRAIGDLVKRACQLSSAGLDPVFAAEGATLTQWAALVLIHFDRGSTCAELARELAYDKGATTRLVDKLVEREWVLRTPHPTDRRTTMLSLTSSGEGVARRCRARLIDCWNDWLRDWAPSEAAELVRLLQKLRDTLQSRT